MTDEKLNTEVNLKIENILRKFKDFDISELLSITIRHKTILEWQKEIETVCLLDSSKTELIYLREQYIKVLNLLTQIVAIKSILYVKFNAAEYKYETLRGKKVNDILSNNKKLASSTIDKALDGNNEIIEFKSIRIGSALMLEIFNLFESHLNRTLNVIRNLMNTDILINKREV